MYDFLDHDVRRIGSFLSQVNKDGLYLGDWRIIGIFDASSDLQHHDAPLASSKTDMPNTAEEMMQVAATEGKNGV